jgi:hypothetical protein
MLMVIGQNNTINTPVAQKKGKFSLELSPRFLIPIKQQLPLRRFLTLKLKDYPAQVYLVTNKNRQEGGKNRWREKGRKERRKEGKNEGRKEGEKRKKSG